MKQSDKLFITVFFILTWMLIVRNYLIEIFLFVLWAIVFHSYIKEVLVKIMSGKMGIEVQTFA